MNQGEFDRALGQWEDQKLNQHLAEEDAYQNAAVKAEDKMWEMTLGSIYDLMPEEVVKKIDAIAYDISVGLAESLLEGSWKPN